MNISKQTEITRAKIKKAQAAWRGMSHRARALAQPQGRSRAKPGTTGEGGFYHVMVRPKTEFVTFRTQDVGQKGGIERVAGKRSSGSWDTQKWLIGKDQAHLAGGHLVADTSAARKVLENLGSAPVHVSADRFRARPRRNVPESAKPTPAMRRAQRRNIRKAQAARHAH